MAVFYRVDFTKGPVNNDIKDGFKPDIDTLHLGSVFVDEPNMAGFNNGLELSVYRSALDTQNKRTVDNSAVVQNLGFGPDGIRPNILHFMTRITFVPVTGPMPDPSVQPVPVQTPRKSVWAVGAVLEHFDIVRGVQKEVRRLAATFQTRDSLVRLNVPQRDPGQSATFEDQPGDFWIPQPQANSWTWCGGEVTLETEIDRSHPTGKTQFAATIHLPNPAPGIHVFPITFPTPLLECQTIFPISSPPPIDKVGASIAIAEGEGTATVRLVRMEIITSGHAGPGWWRWLRLPWRAWWYWWRWLRLPWPRWIWWPFRARR